MSDSNENKKKVREPKEVVVLKNTYDYQRMKLDRLMKNPVTSLNVMLPNAKALISIIFGLG